ncbi:DNA-protecting protein DprA [Pseudomonas sp. RG1]|uniref:DNA-processing protein DprA n=1 Tax=Pseudomonas sp. RG1 TaxID=2981602 RepID=UPI00222082CC|nr:DNA-processing protein DprA [Pseudomonas sp. RG1]MCW0920875.1 DNA-protecting protein DprA [Pseudomonas sp. RG1]
MVISEQTEKMLGLSLLKGIGPASLHQIATFPDFLTEDIGRIANKLSKLQKAIDGPGAWDTALEQARYQIAQAEASNCRILSLLDSEYPSLLRLTKDAPYIIYVKGKLHLNPEKSVAIIGTRQPTAHGTLIAERITNFFAKNQWSVVSGLALGCDTIAHQAALVAGGHTVAVLAHGLHTISPSSNKRLASEILESGGALISEYGFGSAAIPAHFVKRDRTQAGLAQGVIMIQSDIRGGSLHASRAALQYGRWLTVPYPTERDRQAEESKIQANMLFASNKTSEISDLLKCDIKDLERLHIITGKEDYQKIIGLEKYTDKSQKTVVNLI